MEKVSKTNMGRFQIRCWSTTLIHHHPVRVKTWPTWVVLLNVLSHWEKEQLFTYKQ